MRPEGKRESPPGISSRMPDTTGDWTLHHLEKPSPLSSPDSIPRPKQAEGGPEKLACGQLSSTAYGETELDATATTPFEFRGDAGVQIEQRNV